MPKKTIRQRQIENDDEQTNLTREKANNPRKTGRKSR